MIDGGALARLFADARCAGFKVRLGEGSTILILRDDAPGVSIPAQSEATRLDTGDTLDGLDGVRSFLGLVRGE
jgi:hypothetical protein